jgi:two-component system response regulator PilR (NtrC family)
VSVARTERRPRGELSRVLVVDDEPDIRELIDLTLARMGLATECAGSVGEAIAALKEGDFQLCLTDMRLPDGEGLEIVRYITEHCPQTPVAVITAFGSAGNAVAALKAGAFDYLAKPVGLEQLRALIKSALRLPGGGQDSEIRCRPDRRIAEHAAGAHHDRKLARSQAPIYISGESGSGKELGARLIHSRSARAAGAFVPVNCGAIPENLMESEFFGYRKGAFTGAQDDRDGFFQAASGGTLFLDEVADLPLAMQVKLLRAIQEKRVRKVGSVTEEPVDVRIICATHKNLRDLVDKGAFRQDLYYRLNVIELRMPPCASVRKTSRRWLPPSCAAFLATRRPDCRRRRSRRWSSIPSRQRARAGKHPGARHRAVLRRQHRSRRPATRAGGNPRCRDRRAGQRNAR